MYIHQQYCAPNFPPCLRWMMIESLTGWVWVAELILYLSALRIMYVLIRVATFVYSYTTETMTGDHSCIHRWDQPTRFCSSFFWSLSFPMLPAKVRRVKSLFDLLCVDVINAHIYLIFYHVTLCKDDYAVTSLFVRLSVCHIRDLCLNGWTYRRTFSLLIILVFSKLRQVHPPGDVKYKNLQYKIRDFRPVWLCFGNATR